MRVRQFILGAAGIAGLAVLGTLAAVSGGYPWWQGALGAPALSAAAVLVTAIFVVVGAASGIGAASLAGSLRCGRATRIIRVRIPADLSHTGEARFATKAIDAGIADIVSALQSAGITMRGSCCGHGAGRGEILLDDGRALHVACDEGAAD